MVDDSPEDLAPSPDSGRAKREPPTIDLEASEVTAETASRAEAAKPGPTDLPPPSPPPRPVKSWISIVLIAAMAGAGAGALVTGLVGGGTVWPEPAAPSLPPSAPVNSAGIDDLAARLTTLEARTSKPALATPDPATVGRIEALEKSLAALRGQFDGLRAQSEKLAGALSDVKTVPREAPAPDLGGIKDRIAGLERAISAQQAAIAQQIAQGSAKPADDAPLRRTVAAALLDVQVRFGDPYAAALTAAKALAPHPETLRPLDPFAASGVPSPALLCRDLLALVPKLSPPAPAAVPGSGIVERLEAGAAKLVRIERTDTKGTDRDSVVARVTAAALRNDVNEARRELNTLPPAERAAAQGWIEKADTRDAALSVSRQFAAESMAALAPPMP